MKKLLCFLTSVLFVLSGLYAQNCVNFALPNLTPGPADQTITLTFSNAGLDNNKEYALNYEFYKKTNEESDFHLMTDLEMDNDFNLGACTFLARFRASNYYGEYINHASGYFPNGPFEAGGNMSDHAFNFFTGSYLNLNGGGYQAQVKLNLGWRSGMDYTGLDYMIVVKLVTMKNGELDGLKYGGKYIGGSEAELEGTVVTMDTITTIKYLTEIENDTLCYNEAFGYQKGRITLTADTINKYRQGAGEPMYSIFTQQVVFGDACNGRIDSIGLVRFFVRNELTLSNAGTGNNLEICSYSKAGYVKVTPAGGNAPYTVYAYKKLSADTYATTDSSRVTIDESGITDTLKGLRVGTYKLVCVDNAGCEVSVAEDATIAATSVNKTYTITATQANIMCNGAHTGSITDVTATINAGGEAALPLTYQWEGPDSYTSTSKDISGLAAGDYIVTVTDKMGCESSKTFNLTENAAITSTKSVACCASELPYRYDPDGADTVFTTAGTKDVHYTSVAGCDSIVTVTLTVRDNPTVDWGNTPATVCQGATLTASANTGMSNYYWTKNGAATTDDGNTANFSWDASGAQTISVNFTQTITDNGLTTNCRVVEDTTKTITVNPLPDNSVTTKVGDDDATMDITACAGKTVTLSAAENASYKYEWMKKGSSDPIGNARVMTLEDITDANAGKYFVVLTDTSAARGTNCAITSDTVTLTVNTPTLTLSDIVNDTICDGGTATLTTTASDVDGELVVWAWSENASATNSADYTVAGTYTVTATATRTVNNVNCPISAEKSGKVTVLTPSIALVDKKDTTLCYDATITLTATPVGTPVGTVSYEWKHGNTTVAAQTIEDIVVTQDTVFYMKATANVTSGTVSCPAYAYDTVRITVNKPTLTLSDINDTIICNGGTATLKVTASNYSDDDAIVYEWSNNASTTNSAQYTAADTYTVTVTVTKTVNHVECSISDEKSATVSVLSPSVTLKAITDTTVCFGKPVTLPTESIVATSNGELSYVWNDGTSNLNNYTVTPEVTTTYNLTVTNTLTAYNGAMECPVTATASKTITVNTPAIASLTVTPNDTTICQGGAATIVANATSSDAITYLWDTQETGSTIHPATANTYTVTATATKVVNEVSCTLDSVKSAVVKVLTPSIALQKIGDKTVCDGTPVTLEAQFNGNPAGTPSYEWKNKVETISTNSSIEFIPTQDTTIYLKATATLTSGTVECPANDYDTIDIFVNIPKITSLTIAPSAPAICQGESQTLTATAVHAGNISYTWTPSATLNQSNTAEVTATPEATTEYTLTCVDTISRNGVVCTANKTENITVTVNDTVQLKFHAGTDANPTICLGGNIEIEVDSANCETLTITPALPAGLTFANGKISGTPTAAATYAYTISAVSDNGCTAYNKTIGGTITVNDTTVLRHTAGLKDASICLGNPIEDITFTVEHGTMDIIWSGDSHDGLAFTNGTISGTPANYGTITYKVVAANEGNHCPADADDTITGTIIVKDTVTLSATNTDQAPICFGSAITPIEVTNTNSTVEITWTGDNSYGLTFANGKIEGTPTSPVTIGYTIKATSNNGCTNYNKEISGTIVVNDTVKLTVENGTQTICRGENINPIPVLYSNATINTLSLAEGLNITAADGTDTITGAPVNANTYNYTITATSNNGCTGTNKSKEITIVVNDTVTLSATNTDQDPICFGNAITPIEVTNTNSTVSVIWDNNNSYGLEFANGKIEGTPTSPVTIGYTIKATSNNGCTNYNKEISGTIVVNDTAHPTLSNANICVSASEANDTLTISTIDGMESYSWNVDGGTIVSGSDTKTVQVQWSTTGDKNVSVTCTNASNCSGTARATISVKEAPAFTITGSDSDNKICADAKDTLSINYTGTANITNYGWNPTDSLTPYNDNGSKQVFKSSIAGEYTYTATLTNEFSCKTSNTITIKVNPLPEIEFTTITNPYCYQSEDGYIMTNVTNGTQPYTYSWEDGSDKKYRENIPAGTYTLTVTDRNGCKATESTTLTDPTPITLTKDNHVDVTCYGANTGSFRVNATGGTPADNNQYKFSQTPTGGTFASNNYTFTDLLAGVYTIYVTDNNGCQQTIKDTIKQPEELKLDSMSQVNVTCHGRLTGTATVKASKGTAPYRFSKDGSDYTDATENGQHTFEGLAAGSYTLYVKDNCNSIKTVNFNITEPAELSITDISGANNYCKDATAEALTVTATNGNAEGSYNYEWKVSSDNGNTWTTVGTSANSYTPVTTTADTFLYKVIVTDCSVDTKTAEEVTVIVWPALSVVTASEDNTYCKDADADILSVTVIGSNDYQYQWYANGTAIDGATGATYKPSTATYGSDTTFSVKVTDTKCGDPITINVANIKVYKALTVDDIANETICVGTSTTLTANASNGMPDYTYQWYKGNDAIQGATNDSYATPTADAVSGQSVTYKVAVNDQCASTVAVEKSVTVSVVNALAATTNLTDTTICVGTSAVLTVTPSEGTPDYTYKWYKGDNLIDNATSASYTTPTTDAVSGQSVTYKVEVKDACANTAPVVKEITVKVNAALAVADIADQTICVGSTTTLTATASNGTPDYTYQWYKGDAAIDGATSASYTTPADDAVSGQSVTYMVEVKDQCATSTTASDQVKVSVVNALAATTNLTDTTICVGTSAVLTVTPSEGTPDYTYKWYKGDNLIDNATSASYTTPTTDAVSGQSVTYKVEVKDACANTAPVVKEITVKVNAALAVADIADQTICVGSTTTLTATASNGTPDYTYQWYKGDAAIDGATSASYTTPADDAVSGQSVTYMVEVKDQCATSTTASDQVKVSVVNALAATTNLTDTTICVGTSAVLTVTPSEGTPDYTYKWYKGDNLIDNATSASYTTPTTDAVSGQSVTYKVEVKDACANTAPVVKEITVKVNAALAVADIADQTICVGSTTTLTATASNGTPDYTYQWYKGNEAISGATSASYTTLAENATSGSNVIYKVEVKDQCATSATASDEVKVSVVNALAATTNLSDTTICVGTSAVLTVTPSAGTTPYTYQWYKNDNAIQGETNDTYTTPTDDAVSGESVTYKVVVKDACEQTTPVVKEITVKVNAALAVADIADTTICVGTSVTLAPEISGGNTDYSYAWYLDGSTTPIANASAATYTTPAADATDDANHAYMLKVTDACGTEKSNTFTVKVYSALTIAETAHQNINCYDEHNGSITVNVTGGHANYQYKIDNEAYGTATDATSKTFEELAAGIHTIYVKDACGTEKSIDITLTQPAQLAATIASQTNVDCKGNHTGAITVEVTTGTGTAPFTYKRKNVGDFGTSAEFTGLLAGKDTIVVKDAHGCIANVPFEITEPSQALELTVSASEINCYGENSQISISATGGTPTIEYQLDNGSYSTTHNFTKPAGEYRFVAKDANNCTDTVVKNITQPAELTINATVTNLSCYGSNDGKIDVTVAGGTSPYSYYWTDDNEDEDRTGLAAGSYTLNVYDTKQCRATMTKTLTQPENFSVVISGMDSICAGTTTDFTADVVVPHDSTYTYTWYKVGETTPMTSVTGLSVAGDYAVVATQSTTNCTKSDTVTLTVLAVPELVFTHDPNKDTVCLHTAVTITVSGANNGYSWTGGGSDDVEHVVDVAGTHYYEVTGTNTFGTHNCIATAKDTVVVLPLPSATLQLNGNAIADNTNHEVCFHGEVDFSVPEQSDATYQWYKDGTAINGSTSFKFSLTNVSAEDNGAYKAIVTSEAGCDSTSYTVTVKVNPLPSATITATVDNDNYTAPATITVCAKQSVHLTVPGVSEYNYEWKKGEEIKSTTDYLNFGEITTAQAGTYTVKVTNPTTGCDSTSTITIVVDTLPVITLSSFDSICINTSERFDTLTLTTEAATGYTYAWTIGGDNTIVEGGTATDNTVKVQWSTVGTPNVTVQVTNGRGCSSTANKSISVKDIDDFTIAAAHARFCADAYDTLTVTGAATTTFEWSAPAALTMTDGNAATQKAFKAADNSRTTEFTVTVKATTDKGCQLTKEQIITVDSLPIVTVNDEEICRNTSIALEAFGAVNYVWAPADSLNSDNGASVTFTSRGAGTFNIVVTGTDSHNCSATDTATIKVNDLPGDGHLATLNDKRFCKGGVSGFKVSGFSTYVWTSSPEDGSLIPDNDTATFTGNTPGNYVIKVEVTDVNGCKSSTSANVIVDTLPVPTITADADVCVNGELTFTTEHDNVSNYVWTVDGLSVENSSNTLTRTWTTSGEKTVTVNYKDNNNCTAVTPTSKTITVHALPVVEITEGRDSTICRGSSITLHATSDQNETSFDWDNNVGSDVAQVTVTPVTNDSTFVVTGTYWPVAGTLSCANTDTITVHLQDTVKLTVSNATQTKCLGQPIDTIKVNYEAATLSWSGNFTDGIETSDETGLYKMFDTIKNPGTYTYVVTATSTNTYACDPKEETITLVINDTNKLSSNSDLDQVICLGQPIEDIVLDTANCTLAFSPALNTMNLTFDPATATISGTPTEAATETTFTITATATNDGCNAEKTLEFKVTVKDTNKLSSNSDLDQVICLGQPIENIVLDTANCTLEFAPALSTMGLTFDPATATISGTPAAAADETTFTITAKATNTGCNADKTLEFKITVNDTVKIATIDGDNLKRKLCEGTDLTNEVKVWATNGNIAIGSGTIPAGMEYSISNLNDTITLSGTLSAAGNYEFYVVATGTACTTSKDSLLVSIVVDTIPAVTLTTDDEVICPNGQQTITLTATAGYERYTWSTDNVEGTSNTLSVSTAGTYTVTVKNGEGCVNETDINITLHTLPGTTITSDPTTAEICLGQSATLTAAPDASHTAATYEWVGINAAAATNNELTVTPIADSIFRVRVVDNNGCYDTAMITVKVDTLPNADINASATDVCQNGTVELSANNEGSNLTYLWKEGNDNVGDTRVFNFVTDTNTTSGVHIFTLTVTDGNGCASTSTKDVNVKLVPILSETHNRVKCYGESNASIDLTVRYKESIFVDNTYSWTKEGDDSFTYSDEDPTGLNAGRYFVTVASGVNTGACSASDTVIIKQPDTLTLAFNNGLVEQLCNGSADLAVTVNGGTSDYIYTWYCDGNEVTGENTNTMTISNLTAGTHEYYVTVVDDSNCTAYTPTNWEVNSNRIEVNQEINLGPNETYYHAGYTYGNSSSDEGATFEVTAGSGNGGCDSVIIYTVHMYPIGCHFADDFTVQHSSFRRAYKFFPNIMGDTINTSTDTDNSFYFYVSTTENTWNGKRVDFKYEILLNNNPISNDEFDETVSNLKISSYNEYNDAFFGYALDSARGEAPATTFVYQFPSNSTAYYYDYFNFEAFNDMPHKVDFNFTKPGTYNIKFVVEERTGGDAGTYWGIYNPYAVGRNSGPIWGGRNDNPTGRETIVARYMTVIVGEGNTSNNPVINSIEEYTQNTEPTVTAYPNPTREMLYLDIDGIEGETYFTITDATGKVVTKYSENLLGGKTTLNYSVAKFAQGVYFLNVQNDDTVITKKFIVTK